MLGLAAAPPPAEANLPEGWQQAHDEQGRQYFYHHPSKTSQWEMPTRQALQPPSGGPMGAPADGEKLGPDGERLGPDGEKLDPDGERSYPDGGRSR